MARPRQPIDLLLYKGKKNLTKAEIEERRKTEVKAPSDKVRTPDYLPKDLKREFKKIADELLRIKLITNLDVDALARFVLARKLYLQVTDELLARPQVDDTFAELLQMQDKLFKQCRAAASDLGLTISSRCRLVVPKKEDPKPKTEEEKMFGDAL